MKRFLVYLVWALFPIYAIATNYVVQVNTELNVRSKPKADAMFVGKLRNGTQVDVTTISEGWAAIDYNGNICYVTAKYLVPSGQGTPATSSTKKALLRLGKSSCGLCCAYWASSSSNMLSPYL